MKPARKSRGARATARLRGGPGRSPRRGVLELSGGGGRAGGAGAPSTVVLPADPRALHQGAPPVFVDQTPPDPPTKTLPPVSRRRGRRGSHAFPRRRRS